MPHIDPAAGCTGCTGCYASCPKAAITLQSNRDGFYTAQIDSEKCIDCGVCIRACTLLDKRNPARDVHTLPCQYVYSLDAYAREQSASGGFFYLMAQAALKRGSLVCGCVWDGRFTARHVCTDSLETVQTMRQSKYVQSDMGDCFRQIKTALANGRTVFFTGTPCQTTSLNRFVGHYRTRLLTCAVICGGVPSPKVWKAYQLALEKKAGARLASVEMRSKRMKWLVPNLYVQFENGASINEVLLTKNLYGSNFCRGLFIMDQCTRCRYRLDTVDADLMFGDHWCISGAMLRKSKNKGASVVIPLSEQGQEALEGLSAQLYREDGNIQDVIDSHAVLMKDHFPNPHREDFFGRMEGEDVLVLLQEYADADLGVNTLRGRVKALLYRTGLYSKLFEWRWMLQKNPKYK